MGYDVAGGRMKELLSLSNDVSKIIQGLELLYQKNESHPRNDKVGEILEEVRELKLKIENEVNNTELEKAENRFEEVCRFQDWRNNKREFVRTLMRCCRTYLSATLAVHGWDSFEFENMIAMESVEFLRKNVEIKFSELENKIAETESYEAVMSYKTEEPTEQFIETSLDLVMGVRNLCLQTISNYYNKKYPTPLKTYEDKYAMTICVKDMERIQAICSEKGISIDDCCIIKNGDVVGIVINAIIYIKSGIVPLPWV